MEKEETGAFEYALERSENIVVCRWNDKNVVTIASNCESMFPSSTVSRFSQKVKYQINVAQPKLIQNACRLHRDYGRKWTNTYFEDPLQKES